jgi:hypothetical protein
MTTDKGTNQKVHKELLQNKNSTPNNANNTLNEELYDAQKVSPFSTSLTLEKQRRWEHLVNHIKINVSTPQSPGNFPHNNTNSFSLQYRKGNSQIQAHSNCLSSWMLKHEMYSKTYLIYQQHPDCISVMKI